MVGYVQIVQRLPQEWRMTMLELVEAVEQRMREQLAVRREDFDRLSADVRQLTETVASSTAEFREFRVQSEQRLARVEAALEQLAEAQARTEAEVRALTEAQARTEAEVRALTEAQARTEAEFREYRERSEERFARIEATLAQLIEAQVRTEEVLKSLIATQQKFEERLQRLEIRLGQMDGDLLEIRYQERATAYFGRILRRVKVVDLSDILDTLEERLTPDEVDELFNLDLLIRGRARGDREETGPEIWLAVEVSALIDTEDVERAIQRAILLRKAGYSAIPAVAGRNISPVAERVARREGVAIVQDGRSALWLEALAQWESDRA